MNYNEYRNRCFGSVFTCGNGNACGYGTPHSLGTCGYVSKPCNYSCGGGGCRYYATCGGYGGGGC